MQKYTYLFLFCLLGFSTTLSAQALEKKVAADVCDCLEKVDMSGMDYQSFESEMIGCMMTAITSLSEKEIKKGGINLYDEAAMTKFGEAVGQQLAISCPSFEAKIMELMTEEDSELLEKVKEKTEEGSNKDHGEMIGTLVEVKIDKFATLVVKDESGKTHELVWIKYFENSENLMKNQSNWIGKKLTFKFVEYEAYLPKADGYYKIKEVKEIKFGS